MSNNGEDIIRETFEKLGDAIGVQMQIPDAMITNLGAVLQAQIDLLAELQSTGRLIPAGGHVLTAEEWANRITLADKQVAVSEAWEQGFEYGSGHKYGAEDDGVRLTAEQVEDVRTMLWSPGVTALPAFRRLRALFPAAEPAEEPREIGWFRTMTPEFATKHFGFPGVIGSKGFWTHTASDGGKWAWDGDDWELREYPPAPAEPAEEETKAEDYCCHPMCRHTNWGGSNRKHTRGSDCPIVPKPASSPVVPAPTETGPWQTCGHVPIGIVFRSKDRHPAFTWVNEGGSLLSVRNECEDGHFSDGEHCLPSMVDENFAPFVAAEEGRA